MISKIHSSRLNHLKQRVTAKRRHAPENTQLQNECKLSLESFSEPILSLFIQWYAEK